MRIGFYVETFRRAIRIDACRLRTSAFPFCRTFSLGESVDMVILTRLFFLGEVYSIVQYDVGHFLTSVVLLVDLKVSHSPLTA